MGNGRDGKPSDRRGGQWHHSKVTGGDVQPRKKPGAHPRTERLERERRQRATHDTPALVPTPEAPAPGMGSDDDPSAKTHARARADASWDAVFELTVHGPAPAQNEAEPVQHVEGGGAPVECEEAPGNAAAPVQRKEGPGIPGPMQREDSPEAGAPVQRQEAPDAGELAQRQQASQANAPASPSENEGLARVRSRLAQGWVGPLDEAEIERIWGSFGPRVLDVAERHRALWDQCIERGASLTELPAVRAVQARFRADVQARAREILRRNEGQVRAEMMALGINDQGVIDPAGSLIPQDMQADYLAELQERAGDLVAARRALAALRKVPVGFATMGNHVTRWVPLTFNPAAPPPFGPSSELVPAHVRGAVEMRAWDEVMQHHQRLA